MMRRLKYLIAALLGFSTACSTVKQAPRDSRTDDPEPGAVQDADSTALPLRVVVMYGVRPPLSDSQRLQRQNSDLIPSDAAEPRAENASADE